MPDGRPLTDLLQLAQSGDQAAWHEVFGAMYAELHRLARSRLNDGGRGTYLDTTALVHESYLRLAKAGRLRSENRRQFLCYAGHVMRSVIVDIVREKQAQRRGGGAARVTLDDHIGVGSDGEEEIRRVHEAVDGLARFNPRMVQVVEMRYFAGLTESEIAEALGVTDRTVRRDWEKARLLLAQALDSA